MLPGMVVNKLKDIFSIDQKFAEVNYLLERFEKNKELIRKHLNLVDSLIEDSNNLLRRANELLKENEMELNNEG